MWIKFYAAFIPQVVDFPCTGQEEKRLSKKTKKKGKFMQRKGSCLLVLICL